MSAPFDPSPISKAAKNERRKLLASTINTVGLTVFGVGVITPIVTGGLEDGTPLTLLGFSAIVAVLHVAARRVLKGLED